MRVRVILNPWSDRGRAIQYQDLIESVGRRYGDLEIVLTERPRQARELAREVAYLGHDLVVAAGGDGTVHEVVNGLVRGGRGSTRLGVIPIGSGNDFAYGIGIAADTELAITRLFTGETRSVDLAQLEDDRGRFEVFQNNMGLGFDAVVAIQTEGITRVRGFLMYLLAVVRTIAFYYETPSLQIMFDEEIVSQPSLFLALGLGPRSGGGFFVTPDARHDDDLIDSCLVNPVNRFTMMYMLLRIIRGTHIHSKHVSMRQNRRITVRSNLPLPIHVDGEIFAYHRDNVRQVTIYSLPRALQVVV